MGDGPSSGRRGAGAQAPGAGDAGLPAAEVPDELLDRRAAIAELGAELRALADLVTRTEAGADVLRDSARRLRDVAPALGEHTDEILREMGLSRADRERLYRSGAAFAHSNGD